MRYLALGVVFLCPIALVACGSAPRAYGSYGTGETWHILEESDEDAGKAQDSVREQRSWGWAAHFVSTSHDDGVDSFTAGPFAYAGDHPDSIDVSIWVFASRPMQGTVIVEAMPEIGASLHPNWNHPLSIPITMTKTWHSQDITLPQFLGPTRSAHIRWETTGPAGTPSEPASNR